MLCNIGGWPRDVQFARAIGWAFFARKKMAFEEFQRKELVRVTRAKKKFYEYTYQMNHIGGHPNNCCLDHLELGTADVKRTGYAEDAQALYCSVWKRPAAASVCKRHATECS